MNIRETEEKVRDKNTDTKERERDTEKGGIDIKKEILE